MEKTTVGGGAYQGERNHNGLATDILPSVARKKRGLGREIERIRKEGGRGMVCGVGGGWGGG